MTAAPVLHDPDQLALPLAPRVWARHADVPQDEPGLLVRDVGGLTARNVTPGRWHWATQPRPDDTWTARDHWVTGDPWYWPAYLRFPVTERFEDPDRPAVTVHLPTPERQP